jgi:D-alanine-D-alanine ligase-like ATP-grasp enzyme/acylphosphatase
MAKDFVWLPHLENSIPDSAKGYSMSFYAIALEGWRRGLTLKFINKNRRPSELLYEISSNDKSYKFVVSKGELISDEAIRICRNKFEAKRYLQDAKVPTPNGKEFRSSTLDSEIIAFTKINGYPLVVKPSDGTGGKGVIAGIENEQELINALNYVRGDLGFKNVIVEDYFKGEDYRVYVIGDQVAAITKRIPANVIGDGESSIAELIDEGNALRKKSPILTSSLIKVDKELKQMLSKYNYTLSSVPKKDELVYLKSKNNISAGGDPVDITDEVPDAIKQVAIDGVKAIPGLPHAGVDLMVNTETNSATIIEINTQANIRSHLFPMVGKARDVPKMLIDYYFPESKRDLDKPLYFFNVNPVKELFAAGSIKEYVYPNAPQGDVKATRFLVTGQIEGVNYGAWIRRKATDLDVHGYVKFLGNNQVSVVVSGVRENIDHFRGIITMRASKDSVVKDVSEYSRTTPVQIGFKIINSGLDKKVNDGYFPIRLDGIAKLGQKKITKKRKKVNEYERKYKGVISSKSWKVTRPLRKLKGLFK